MKKKPNRAKPSQGVQLKIIGTDPHQPFIGVCEVPGRLPAMLRYPGEPAQAFCDRVLHAVTGDGPLVAFLMYVSNTPPPGALLH